MKLKYPKKIKGKIFRDNRGSFQECFKKRLFKFETIFSAISVSKKNVIRGMHLQLKKKQIIFLSVIEGKIYDVCVNLNKKSKTYKHKFINELIEGDMLIIPKGFAHGFAGVSEKNVILYQFSNYRDKNSEIGLKYDDQDLNIKWPIKKPILSIKDKKNISLSKFIRYKK